MEPPAAAGWPSWVAGEPFCSTRFIPHLGHLPGVSCTCSAPEGPARLSLRAVSERSGTMDGMRRKILWAWTAGLALAFVGWSYATLHTTWLAWLDASSATPGPAVLETDSLRKEELAPGRPTARAGAAVIRALELVVDLARCAEARPH